MILMLPLIDKTILYHGSGITVEKPDVHLGKNATDFGSGFYTTSLIKQAKKWADRFKQKTGRGVVSKYELNESKMRDIASIREFKSYDEEWLDFIIACRSENYQGEEYDVIIGNVADDNIFDTIELYQKKLIDKQKTLEKLKYQSNNNQYCFRNQTVVNECLTFLSSEDL